MASRSKTIACFLFLAVFFDSKNARWLSSGEKLSADLEAPIYAAGAGGLKLDPPFEGPGKVYAAIVAQKNRPNFGDGEYSFSFETADGVQREEVGMLKKVGDELVTVVQGRYSYTSPQGLSIDVKYSADENGARSSFRFGTDSGRWEKSLTLPGLPGSKGKLVSSVSDSRNGYLPPPPAKLNNEYLPSLSGS